MINIHNRIAKKNLKVSFFDYWQVYIILLPSLLYLLIFNYIPIYGILLAFKDFRPRLGILWSEWVGLRHFRNFFSLNAFKTILNNTIILSVYQLAAGFPLPIIFALALNSCENKRFKKTVQTITYAPHFISIVVLVGMLNILFSPSQGIVANLLRMLGLYDQPILVLTDPKTFRHLYVWSGVWASLGWSSIIYLGALSAVDPELHESARVDGASKFQRIVYIDFPTILPTIVILLVLNCGGIMSVGFEKVFLLQKTLNINVSEVISTYVYKIGIRDGQFSLATAVGLFNSGVNFVMLVLVNTLARRFSDYSLW